jgi:hypothetical protein
MALVRLVYLSILLSLVVSAVPDYLGTKSPANAERAPSGCIKLNSDADWPPRATWEATLPGIIPIPNFMKSFLGCSMSAKASEDYRFRVKNAEGVRKAVNLARENYMS